MLVLPYTDYELLLPHGLTIKNETQCYTAHETEIPTNLRLRSPLPVMRKTLQPKKCYLYIVAHVSTRHYLQDTICKTLGVESFNQKPFQADGKDL